MDWIPHLASRWVISGCALALACSFNGAGGDGATDGESDDGSGSTSASASTDDPPDPDSGAASSNQSGSSASTTSASGPAPTSGGESSSGIGEAESETGDPEPAPDLHSCADILAANPQSPSGPYPIADQFGATLRVHCDMDLDGGGWTLVGRSVDGNVEQGNFGWSQRRGDVTELDAPYSLGAFEAGIEFEELLVGEWSTGYQWGEHVYRVEVGPGFLQNTDTAVGTVVTTVAGDCEPDGGPGMLRFAGHTSDTSRFWFRDTDNYEGFGLAADDFNLYWSLINRCSMAGNLSGDPGMIFVR